MTDDDDTRIREIVREFCDRPPSYHERERVGSGLLERLRATAPQRAAGLARAAAERAAWRAAHPRPEPPEPLPPSPEPSPEPSPPSPPPRRTRQRKPTLSGMLRQAAKANVPLRRVVIDPADGRITLVVGEGQSEQPNILDQWIAKHGTH